MVVAGTTINRIVTNACADGIVTKITGQIIGIIATGDVFNANEGIRILDSDGWQNAGVVGDFEVIYRKRGGKRRIRCARQPKSVQVGSAVPAEIACR